MRKSEEPLVVHRFLTWWLIDVCGSSAILLAVHLARTTTERLQRVSNKYCPTGSDQQEDLATLGSVQLRQTFALWTLAAEKGYHSRRMATYCGNSNAPAQYARKERSPRSHFKRADPSAKSSPVLLRLYVIGRQFSVAVTPWTRST